MVKDRRQNTQDRREGATFLLNIAIDRNKQDDILGNTFKVLKKTGIKDEFGSHFSSAGAEMLNEEGQCPKYGQTGDITKKWRQECIVWWKLNGI